MPTPQGTRFYPLPPSPRRTHLTSTLTGTAIATAVSNNQETIMSLAGEIAGIEERIKNLAAFYRYVSHPCVSAKYSLLFPGRADKNSEQR